MIVIVFFLLYATPVTSPRRRSPRSEVGSARGPQRLGPRWRQVFKVSRPLEIGANFRFPPMRQAMLHPVGNRLLPHAQASRHRALVTSEMLKRLAQKFVVHRAGLPKKGEGDTTILYLPYFVARLKKFVDRLPKTAVSTGPGPSGENHMTFSIHITADTREQLAADVAFLARLAIEPTEAAVIALATAADVPVLTDADVRVTHAIIEGDAPANDVADAPAPKQRKARAKKVDDTPADDVPADEPTDTPDVPADEAPAEVTYADIRKAVNSLAAIKGGPAVLTILEQFGVDHANKLDQKQWAEAHALLEAEIA